MLHLSVELDNRFPSRTLCIDTFSLSVRTKLLFSLELEPCFSGMSLAPRSELMCLWVVRYSRRLSSAKQVSAGVGSCQKCCRGGCSRFGGHEDIGAATGVI